MRLLARSGQRGAALQQYAQLEAVLDDEFGATPSEEAQRLYERIGTAEEQAPRMKLPVPSTAFLGRGAELADLALRLARPNTRLLTVLGPGGVGKTRLVIELACCPSQPRCRSLWPMPWTSLCAVAGSL